MVTTLPKPERIDTMDVENTQPFSMASYEIPTCRKISELMFFTHRVMEDFRKSKDAEELYPVPEEFGEEGWVADTSYEIGIAAAIFDHDGL